MEEMVPRLPSWAYTMTIKEIRIDFLERLAGLIISFFLLCTCYALDSGFSHIEYLTIETYNLNIGIILDIPTMEESFLLHYWQM